MTGVQTCALPIWVGEDGKREGEEAAREEMRKYVERKMEEMLRIMREKSEGISKIIPEVYEKDF